MGGWEKSPGSSHTICKRLGSDKLNIASDYVLEKSIIKIRGKYRGKFIAGQVVGIYSGGVFFCFTPAGNWVYKIGIWNLVRENMKMRK